MVTYGLQLSNGARRLIFSLVYQGPETNLVQLAKVNISYQQVTCQLLLITHPKQLESNPEQPLNEFRKQCGWQEIHYVGHF